MKLYILSFLFSFIFSFSIQAKTVGFLAQSLWGTLDQIAKLENLQMHSINGDQDSLHIDQVACVTESYDGCAFFAHLGADRKLIVHQDLAPKMIDILLQSGVPMDDNGGLYVSDIECIKASAQYTCYLD
jgi:hypothetical protein